MDSGNTIDNGQEKFICLQLLDAAPVAGIGGSEDPGTREGDEGARDESSEVGILKDGLVP